MSETTAFVLEIGCEEIPARFLEGAERDLGERLGSALREARLLAQDAPAVKTASTPRRLLAYAPALLRAQPDRVEQLTGPPVKAAFDKEGKPTRAAESFAAKNKAHVSDLKRVTTAKGEYLALEVAEAGKPALQVLVEVLPSVLGGMTFPKNMYWTAKAGPLFVRPIRWILALLDDGRGPVVVPFEFAGVKSGNLTYGHRLQGSQPVAVTDLNLDLLLEKHLVVVHAQKRCERVRQGIKAFVEESGFKAAADEWLETWVMNSTEWPVPLMGGFDPRYLALPREVLVTVMRDHQKYFAVEDEAGNLQPQFITVLNVPGDPRGLIRQGHERVLAARFADAEFFWNADQKVKLRDRIPMLERVTYQAKLGTYADKVQRMKALAEKVCDELEQAGSMNAAERQHALRAVELCKCDLTTQMVQEFTELQGIMGGLYAKAQGKPDEVADAIYDHYKPVGIEDTCPRSIVGAVVSLADKLDSVVAGFSVGLEPTGSSDPFGLRRAGNGIVKLFVEAMPTLNLAVLNSVEPGNLGEITKFLEVRFKFYAESVGHARYDSVSAVLPPQSSFNHPAAIMNWIKAVERVRDTEDFMVVAQAAKRVKNILAKSGILSASGMASQGFNNGHFQLQAETDLAARYHEARQQGNSLGGLQSVEDCEQFLLFLASLRPAIDCYFKDVLVMDNDSDIRTNRLLFLQALNYDVFERFVDLSEIQTPGSSISGSTTPS
ncbi:MAG TPA: glycine--tRNA ligase subunit beta [Terriglobia bacterium]|nr:glycine--tRNA ligase subunit beta [Terriglobia bacterium]